MISKKIKENILFYLKTKNKGASASEIQRKINYNRTTITKYLHILNTEGQITNTVQGMAKIWTLSESPIIALLTKKDTSSENNYIHNIFDILNDTGVRILNKDKKIIWINKTLSLWIGDNSNNFVDMSCCSGYCQNNAGTTLCLTKKTLKTGKPTTFETIMNTYTHKNLDVKINSYAIKDNTGSICGIIQLIENLNKKQNIKNNTYSNKQINETSRVLSVLQNISYDATKSFEKEEFLQNVITDVLYLLRISTGMIYLIDKKTTQLKLITSKGVSKEFIKECKINPARIGKGLVGKIAKTGEIIYIKENASNDPRVAKETTKKEKLQSFIGLPLKTRDSIRGVLIFANKEKHNFEPYEKNILSAISNQVSYILENANLFKKTKESKNLYKSFMKASPNAVILVDLNSKITQASKHAVDMFKTTKEKFVGKNAFDFIAEKDKKISMTNFKKAINDGFLYDAEYKLLLGDNTTIIGETNGVCIKDIYGNPTGILTIIKDITKRKKIEKKLMESEMRYRLLFENTKDAIFILDAESKPFGRIISANNAAAKIYGYNIEELQKSNIRNLEDSITKKESQHRIEKLIHGKSITTELIHIKKDKTKFHVEISASPIELNNHKYILTNIRDITLRKKSEKNLNETKNYLETIIQMSSNGIFVVDEKGNFEFGNKACTNICGWQPHELIGKPFIQLIHPKYHEFILERWTEAQNNNAKPYETVIITKNGKEKHISVSHKAIKFKGQRKYIDIIKDITVRKKMDAQKEFLEKVIENCTDAIVSINMSYLTTSWNPAAEKLLGFKKEEVLGTNVLKHLVPKELKLEREKLIYEASKNGSASIKTKRYRKDNTLVSVILTISPIYDNIAQLIGYSVILKDAQSIKNNSII